MSDAPAPIFRRILLKLSGESLMGSLDYGTDPQRLAEVAEQARAHRTTTIFFETLVSPKISETLAKEIGAKTAVLDPIEGLQPGSDSDYLSVMRANLSTLRTALGCT